MSSLKTGLNLGDYVGLSDLAASLKKTFSNDLSRVLREGRSVTVRYGDLVQVENVVRNAHVGHLKDIFKVEYSDSDDSLVMDFRRVAYAKVFMNFYEGIQFVTNLSP